MRLARAAGIIEKPINLARQAHTSGPVRFITNPIFCKFR
jgi:hypothetical protein